MANPTQRDLLVEIAFGADLTADPATWAWTDVSADLLGQTISIRRGRADEAGETQPMSTALTLDNIRGDYTPDNPVGAYYPNVKRGTPLRITAPGGQSYFRAGDPQVARFTTPDTAALDITGDLDVRIDLDPAGVLDPVGNDLIGKYGAVPERSWLFAMDGSGLLRLYWSPDGTALSSLVSTVPAPTTGRCAYRATLDVNNGAGGHTVTFYSAPSIDGPWTQLGDPVVGSGTTSIHNSTSPLHIGSASSLPDLRGKVLVARVHDGIGGSLVADADFRPLAPGTTSFTDSAGRTWTSVNGAVIANTDIRFIGHIDEWAPSWPAGDVIAGPLPHSVVDLTASSVRRRLLQGNTLVASPIRGALPAAARPTRQMVAYWPMEDGPDATSFGSAVPAAAAMRFLGAPRPAATSDYVATEPLPTFNGAGAIGAVPTYASPTDRWQVSAVVVMPEGGVTDEAILLDIHTNGTAARWLLKYDTAGTAGQLRLQVFNTANPPAEILNTTVDPDFDGRPFLVYIEGGNSGSNALWTIGYAVVTDFSTVPSVIAPTGTINSASAPRVTTVGVGTGLDLNNDIAIGHVAVYNAIQVFFFEPRVYRSLIAYAGESAIERFTRVCEDAGLDYQVYGGEGQDSELMGAQATLSVTEALTECAATDDGIFLDRRDAPGLLLRPRVSLYRQDPVLVLDAAVNGIANPFQPVLDDQRIRNDVTVTRADGGSTRATDQASVDAEGLYEDPVTLSLFTDEQTAGQAWWRLHLGTVPGMRYSSITVDFDTAPPEVLQAWLTDDVDVGDLIQVQNLPRQHAPDDLDLIVQGYTETISQSRWQVTFNCSPGTPYRVGYYDAAGTTRESRYASGGTTLAEDLDATETAIDIDTPDRPPWTTDPAHYPLDIVIGGERITAAGCTGAGPAQTFTGCTRSVNGVVKTHTTGATVELYQPTYYAL